LKILIKGFGEFRLAGEPLVRAYIDYGRGLGCHNQANGQLNQKLIGSSDQGSNEPCLFRWGGTGSAGRRHVTRLIQTIARSLDSLAENLIGGSPPAAGFLFAAESDGWAH
jgi:hypothetical protein